MIARALATVAALLAGLGCAELGTAVAAANVQRAAGHAAADVLRDVCTRGYEQATTAAEIDALDARGCPELAHAVRALRTSHAAVVAVLHAIEAGRCDLRAVAPRECNLAAAARDAADAHQDTARALSRVQGGP